VLLSLEHIQWHDFNLHTLILLNYANAACYHLTLLPHCRQIFRFRHMYYVSFFAVSSFTNAIFTIIHRQAPKDKVQLLILAFVMYSLLYRQCEEQEIPNIKLQTCR